MKTNQLPPLPTPKFTETIRGVPCITVTEHEHLMRAYALQASAKVQGEAFGYIHHFAAHDERGVLIDATWEADGCADPLPHPTFPSMWKWTHCTPFYTTSQPVQATQAEVTDEQILDIAAEWSNRDFANGAWRFCTDFARAILALRPERVPMTDEQRNDLICTVTTLGAKLSRQALVGMAIDWTESHHSITAKEGTNGEIN